MLLKLCRNRIHLDDLVVLSEPFACNSALEKSNCSWIEQENRRNTIHGETLQSLSSAQRAFC